MDLFSILSRNFNLSFHKMYYRIGSQSRCDLLATFRGQFHQHFTKSFSDRRSQKCKKTDSLTVFFALFGSGRDTNILWADFMYVSVLRNFYKLIDWVCNFLANIDEIDTRCQFYQHFMSSFYVHKCFAQLLWAYSFGIKKDWYFYSRLIHDTQLQ